MTIMFLQWSRQTRMEMCIFRAVMWKSYIKMQEVAI